MRKILISIVVVLCAALVVACSNSKSEKKAVELQNDNDTANVEGVDTLADFEYDENTYEINGITFHIYEASDGDEEYESSASLTLPVPNGDKVLEKILRQVLRDDIDINDIQGYLDKTYAPEAAPAAQSGDEEEEEIKASTIWRIEPVLVLDKYLVMEVVDGYMDQFMAHHDILQSTIVFDRTTGDIMTRDDMFDEDADWLKIARKFRESANEDLGEFDGSDFADPDGFLIDEVFNRGDFYFNDDSLFFVYGPYEINYAFGFDVKMGVSKEWIKPYMNKEDYLYKYWFRNK
ncbi:MAG: DUF3298 domain-containing protein [Bacteroidales bacterium]|nr:DUF3298 domain-containing protein [Bacteroidales bacterium]